MRIAIASGKGGTGKTTIATNLAYWLRECGEAVHYLDCDVEAPNGHLFLKPALDKPAAAVIPTPIIDDAACTACGACVRFCAYNALARLGDLVIVVPELCHGCGGCARVCPSGAITETQRVIGETERGASDAIVFSHGALSIGEAMSPPLIRAVLNHAAGEHIEIIDAPPGTSCPVIAAIRDADFVVLVTEPTPFGLSDLDLALAMVRELALPHGVVINRAEPDVADARVFCELRGARVLAEIGDNRSIAEAYSRGEMIIDAVPDVREQFSRLWNALSRQVRT
jgi:MinD superfamily P-loop ATPase